LIALSRVVVLAGVVMMLLTVVDPILHHTQERMTMASRNKLLLAISGMAAGYRQGRNEHM
jgi:hypothetical protein